MGNGGAQHAAAQDRSVATACQPWTRCAKAGEDVLKHERMRPRNLGKGVQTVCLTMLAPEVGKF